MPRSTPVARRFSSLLLTLSVGCSFSSGGRMPGPDAGDPRDSGLVPTDAASSALRRSQVVAAIGTNVIFPEAQAFEASAAALDAAVAAFAAAPTDGALRDAARAAWRDTMAIVQRLELMQIGPAAHSSASIGGSAIRDEYYSWPLVSRCGVDQRVVSQTYQPVATLGSAPINVRGMAALEYLLFNESSANTCDSFNAINANGTWAAVPDRDARRAAYAASVATLVHQRATQLRNAWDPAGGNFVATLANAGASGNPFPSAQEALNGISNALFYVDLMTKDMKLALPAGISESCGAESCPDAVELPYSDASLAAIRSNLVAFRLVFTGGPDPALGFDDLLVDLGQGAVATQMLTEVDQAIALVDALTGPLEVDVDANAAGVDALYVAVKDMTDLLKGQFLALLDLERPMSAAGDND